ncbi:unnamed protein product [Ectocarpus sp. 8 AP-2014]
MLLSGARGVLTAIYMCAYPGWVLFGNKICTQITQVNHNFEPCSFVLQHALTARLHHSLFPLLVVVLLRFSAPGLGHAARDQTLLPKSLCTPACRCTFAGASSLGCCSTTSCRACCVDHQHTKGSTARPGLHLFRASASGIDSILPGMLERATWM